MRIAVVTQNFPLKQQPYRGTSSYQTIKCLARRADVEVFSPQAAYPSFLQPKHRPWSKTDLSFQPDGVKTTYFAYPALPIISRATNGIAAASALWDQVKNRKFDLILNYWIYPDGYAAVDAGRRMGCPVILKAIGSDINAVKGVSRLFSKWTMQRADRVLTVSAALAGRVIEMGIKSEKVQPVLNGCDGSVFYPRDRRTAKSQLSIPESDRIVLYVGRLDVQKGLRELVSAFAEVSKDVPNARLVLLGEGPAYSELQQLASMSGIQSRVDFVPPVSSEKVSIWMAASELVCLPSYNEGCPNVVLEALNCGRPVVATNVGGIPELVKSSDQGILVSPQDTSGLASALTAALNSAWDGNRISRLSHRTWDTVTDELMEVCVSVLEERNTKQRSSARVAATVR
jgi:teichuronic acid biosynthesis glycosyltransferase TuaC